MDRYRDCSLCSVEPRMEALRCRFCSGKLVGRQRLMQEIYEDRKLKPRGMVLSIFAAGLGQFFRNRWATGLVFASLIPLCLGLLYVTWSGWSYSHFFVAGSAIFALIVAGADAWFGPTNPEPPCKRACPGGLPIPDYLQLIIDEEYEQGHSFIKTRVPIPGIIGRICPHPCETACFRGVDGEPIAINACKRYLADRIAKNGRGAPPEGARPESRNGPKVAIVGAGPSGLSCAYYLALLGAVPTVYDAFSEPGGRLITTIPDFRLPKDVARAEIADIRKAGVEFKCGVKVGPGGKPVGELLKEHDAVFLATGAMGTIKLKIEGEDAFTDFQEFLAAAKTENPIRLTGRVAVIGGGNAAIDVCRTALRCGAEEVHLLYRRERQQMPAREDEVEAAMREGVHFHYLVTPIRAVIKDGQLKGVVVTHMELSALDESGRPKPVPVKDSERLMDFTTVIPCLGQSVVAEIFDDPALAGLKRDGGRIAITARGCKTSVAGVYAGGDASRGAETAIAALADGRKAALTIFGDFAPKLVKSSIWANLRKRKPFGGHSETPQEKIREEMRCLSIRNRTNSFAEVEEGFYAGQALRESRRCLQCHREL